jgi:hypothetical protein
MILYIFARDQNNQSVHIQNATKSNEYFCLYCGAPMIVRNSEKKLRRPHFAHKANVTNCSPESALHFYAKNLLYNKLKDAMNESEKVFRFAWDCEHCHEEHHVNLIKRTKEVSLERKVAEYRPDISLADIDGKTYAAIEVVVSHKPEEEAVTYYKENKIHLIQIIIKNEVEIELLNADVIKGLFLACKNPKCDNCKKYMFKKHLYILNSGCPRCGETMKNAIISCHYFKYGPERFEESELRMARQNGVFIQNRYSKTIKSKYNANVCPKCFAFRGQFFISELVYEIDDDSPDCKKIDLGFGCVHCENE